MNDNNKVTLFHLLSATAANQNGKQQNGKDNYQAEEEVVVLPYEATKEAEEDFQMIEETPSIAALFEEAEAEAKLPVRTEGTIDDLPEWDQSREQATMKVFASNRPAEEVLPAVVEQSVVATSNIADAAQEEIVSVEEKLLKNEVAEEVFEVSDVMDDDLAETTIEAVVEQTPIIEVDNEIVEVIEEEAHESVEAPTVLEFVEKTVRDEVEEATTISSEVVPVDATVLEEQAIEPLQDDMHEPTAVLEFVEKIEDETIETPETSLELVPAEVAVVAVENEVLEASEENSEETPDTTLEFVAVEIPTAEAEEELIEPLEEVALVENVEETTDELNIPSTEEETIISTDIILEAAPELESVAEEVEELETPAFHIQNEVEETPALELPEAEVEEANNIEYLDAAEDFETEDIDEAYRQRLIALGLEPIETVATETTDTPAAATPATEDVDEALSQMFAPPAPSVAPPAATATDNTTTTDTIMPSEAEASADTHFSPLDFQLDSEETPAETAPAPAMSEAQKQASMLQQFRQLQDRNSTFVFMFGRQQAGKTVVLSSLAYHMGIDEEGLLETRRRVDNLKGAAYLKQLSESVRKGQFMNRTAVGSLYELDLTYTPNNPEVPMNFTFLEMSGEDLTKVELSESSAGDLPSDIEVYLKCPNINVVFMVVVPYEDAEEHDYLVIDFLDYIKERKPDFDYSKLLLLISKWDRYDGLRKDEVDLFVKEQMPRTYSRLKAKKATLARYSIGEVSDDNQQILELNQERPQVVKRWLYQAATGQKIKDANSSFWNKLKQWM